MPCFQGGAWNFETEGALTISASVFTGNQAQYGGAVAGGQYLTLKVGLGVLDSGIRLGFRVICVGLQCWGGASVLGVMGFGI